MSTPTPPSVHNRANPFKARLIANYSLSSESSNKDTRHLVVHLGSSGITYVPGDSLGVVPRNFPRIVDELLSHLGLDPATTVEQSTGTVALRDVLIHQHILNRVSKKFVKAVLEKIPGMPPMVARLWKARVLLKKGDKAAAAATAQEGVKAATEAKSDEYIRMNTEVITEAGK